MMCCGALPGTAIDVCGRRLRVLFNVLNVLGLLIVAARLVAAVSTGWRASQTDSLEALIFKGNFLLWKIMVALEAYALAFTSYKLSRAYHSSYDAAVDYMEELGIEIDWKGERKMQTILIIIACLIGISMNSATMSTYDSIDPFFGNILQNRTTPQAFSALYVFGWPTLVLYTIYHVAFIAYFASTACHITVLLDSFNKKLSSEFESSTCKILSDIRRYRKAHSLLSKVIREADNKFSLSSGIILLVSTVLEFLIIYILASRTRTVSEVLSISIWIMAAAGAISVIIFIGHSVRKKVSHKIFNTVRSNIHLFHFLHFLLPDLTADGVPAATG